MTATTLFPKCPACETILEDATGVGTENKPSAGAWSVCFYCAKLLRFTDTLDLRAATGDEIGPLPRPEKERLIRAQDMALARLRPRLKRPHRMPSWAVEWTSTAKAPPPTDPKVLEWMRTRPEKIKAIMRRFPPECLVRANRVLKIPSPGHPGILLSYTEHGPIDEHGVGEDPAGVSVIDNPKDPGLRAVCEPGWLEVVGYHDGQTPEWVASVLG